MRNEILQEALELISYDENYIIINDGKVEQTNINEDVKIGGKTHYFDNLPLGIKTTNPCSIFFSKDIDVKIIHTNENKNTIETQYIIGNNISVNILNIYFNIVSQSQLKLEILGNHNSQTVIKSLIMGCDKFNSLANAYLLKDAYIKLDSLSLNHNKVQSLCNVYLLEQGSQTSVTNVLINQSNNTQAYTYRIEHLNKDTTSVLNNYAISKNNSTLNLDSNGVIKKGAINSMLSQKAKGIILDMYSAISANPILEIDENEVMANHGASIGEIDEDELYYLMSRGLNREDSERLIIRAFVAPYFKDLKDEKVKSYINEAISKYL